MPFNGTLPHDFPHFATGPTLVEFHDLELGYAEDRVQISEKPFWHEVKADSYGGAEGPPCDVQYLGALVYVQCLLNRFDEANLRTISRIDYGGPASADGEMLPAGWYMRQDGGMEQLRLLSKEYTLTYSKAILRQGRQFSVGTRHQAFALMFECHVDNPCDAVLFEYETGDDPCS